MALTITTTPVPSMWAVRLTATGNTGTVSWYRDTATTSDIYLGDGLSLLDRTVPLDEPVTYYATDDLTLKTAAPLTMASGGLPVLSSTMNSTAYAVTVVSYRPYQGQGVSVWHPVIGRSDPLVSIFPALYPAGDLVIRCQHNTERTNLILMLQPGDPLLLRSTCHDRLDTLTFLMTSWEDPYVSSDAQGGPSYLRIHYQRVTDVAPAWQPPPDRTYQSVLTAHATYQAVLDAYPTYQALLDGAPA
jgi:hypothetical protein